jgi:hypothetical protein
MDWINWFFEGIGTQIISIIIGLLIGGAGGGTIGYRIAKNRFCLIQKQSADDDATQIQIGSNKNDSCTAVVNKKTLKQKQKARDRSVQIQQGNN